MPALSDSTRALWSKAYTLPYCSLLEEGWEIEPEDLAHISPYLAGHINRFGEYSTRPARGIRPEAGR
ncbi:Tn3 family transposase [Streptomyces sp. NPDC058316]|uniref:Tn3 family transposase n=1 Tax=unclassified Streptomyces TaxID=2593676 RepID=UPI00331D9727